MRMKCRICGMFHSDGGECPSSLEPLPGFSWIHSEQKEQREKCSNKMPEAVANFIWRRFMTRQ